MSLTNSIARIIAALDTDRAVYEPREDTMLLLSAIEDLELSGKAVLEVGTGSGLIGLFCAQRGAHVVATDLSIVVLRNLKAATNALGLNVNLLRADLLSGIRPRFDYVIFNPPYLHSHEPSDPSVDGGVGGREIIEKFLAQLDSLNAFVGSCLLLISSLNEPESLLENWTRRFEFECVLSKQMFFEELTVFRVSKRSI